MYCKLSYFNVQYYFWGGSVYCEMLSVLMQHKLTTAPLPPLLLQPQQQTQAQ